MFYGYTRAARILAKIVLIKSVWLRIFTYPYTYVYTSDLLLHRRCRGRRRRTHDLFAALWLRRLASTRTRSVSRFCDAGSCNGLGASAGGHSALPMAFRPPDEPISSAESTE